MTFCLSTPVSRGTSLDINIFRILSSYHHRTLCCRWFYLSVWENDTHNIQSVLDITLIQWLYHFLQLVIYDTVMRYGVQNPTLIDVHNIQYPYIFSLIETHGAHSLHVLFGNKHNQCLISLSHQRCSSVYQSDIKVRKSL